MLILAIALIWLCETAVVQEYTLNPYFKNYATWIEHHAARWAWDFLVILFILNVLPRKAIWLVMGLSFIFSLTLVTYFDHFQAPLSEQLLLTQTGEATEFTGYVLDVVSLKPLLLLFFALILKLWILSKTKLRAWTLEKLRNLAFICVLAGSIFSITMSGLPRLYQLAMFNKWTIYAEVYGYLPAWAMNYYYNSDPELALEKAIKMSQPIPDKGIDFNIPVKPDTIIIIQAESLDFTMLNMTTANGELVMPYLHSILDKSLLYKVKYDYSFGTATADFELTTGLLPGGDRIPYKVAGFPFEKLNSLPRIAHKKGFDTSVFHGNHGHFYGRENAFKAVGFDQIFFTPELENSGIAPYKNYILDRDAFSFALKKLENDKKQLHFIITMTTHGPWDYQPDSENQIFQKPDGSIQNYFNAMRYMDNVLAEYIQGLPEHSLIVLFGDHVSAQKYEGHELGVVPFIVYQKGENLRFDTPKQKKEAQSGNFVRTDLIGAVYRYLTNY